LGTIVLIEPSGSRSLAMTMRRFVPMGIVHRLAVELGAVIDRMLAARGRRTVIALAVVEMVVYMAIEVIRAVKPGTCANEHPAREPLWTIVSVGSAVVRRNLVVAIRTNRRFSNLHGYLCRGPIRGSKKQASRNSRQTKIPQHPHNFTSDLLRRICA